MLVRICDILKLNSAKKLEEYAFNTLFKKITFFTSIRNKLKNKFNHLSEYLFCWIAILSISKEGIIRLSVNSISAEFESDFLFSILQIEVFLTMMLYYKIKYKYNSMTMTRMRLFNLSEYPIQKIMPAFDSTFVILTP